jgi:CMP-N-acetylneuraminic acid synthetase
LIVRGLLGLIAVGCDGRSPELVKQTLGGRTLLDLAVRKVISVDPEDVLICIPAGGAASMARSCGVQSMERAIGKDSLEDALSRALSGASARITHVLCIDPLLPLIKPARLVQAVAQAKRDNADCVFSCHHESAMLWHRSPMGLVPYFDPARRPDLNTGAQSIPWLREDGGFYLLTVASFLSTGCRHGGRLSPLETSPQEAVVADGHAGLSVCRALAAELARQAAAG